MFRSMIIAVDNVLSLAGVVMILLAVFAKFGKTKAFRFALGEVAIATSIVSAFRTVLGNDMTYLFGVMSWFIIGSANFVMAIWPESASIRTKG